MNFGLRWNLVLGGWDSISAPRKIWIRGNTPNTRSPNFVVYTTKFGMTKLVSKMASAGEDHRHVAFVGGGDDFFVPH
jgi:hypothetical protein